MCISRELTNPKLGDFDTELTEEFLEQLHIANITLHARVLYGSNTHHKIEALFKAFGRALREAVEKCQHYWCKFNERNVVIDCHYRLWNGEYSQCRASIKIYWRRVHCNE